MGGTIYNDSDIVVRACMTRGHGPLVITFSPHGYRDFTQGWGESFFEKRGIDGVYIISKRHHWFQVEGMEKACRLINERVGRNRSVTTYGSSMGAHAALAFSGRLQAERIFAVAPQYGIRGVDGTPWLPTWYAETEGLSNIYTLEAGLSRTARIYAVYDPLNRFDLAHMKAIEGVRGVFAIRSMFTGHNTLLALNRAGVLAPMILGVLDEGADLSAQRRLARSVRRESVGILLAAAEKLGKGRHHERAQRLVQERAYAVALRWAQSTDEAPDLAATVEALTIRIILAHQERDYATVRMIIDLLGRRYGEKNFSANASKLMSALDGHWADAHFYANEALGKSNRDLYRRADAMLLAVKVGKLVEADHHARILQGWVEAAPAISMETGYVAAIRSLAQTEALRSLALLMVSGRVRRRRTSRTSIYFLDALGTNEIVGGRQLSKRRAAKVKLRQSWHAASADAGSSS